jgi:hypothetical protein
MKGIATAIVLMSMTTASAAEIRCQDAPGREQNGVLRDRGEAMLVRPRRQRDAA